MAEIQSWCLHCETVFSTVEPPEMCPKCGAGFLDVFQIDCGLIDPRPEHWPMGELQDGKVYTLYE